MRLGVSTSLGGQNAREWAKLQKELGCKSVVFPIDSSADEKTVDEYVNAALENDLLIAEVGIWRNALSPDTEERKRMRDYSVAQLKLADRIGARCCVNVAGAYGPVWDGAYKENFSEKAFRETVEMAQEIIDRAEPEKTYFTLEPMPWMIPSSPEEYLRLIDSVDRESFGVHMDIINMINCPDRFFFPEVFLRKCFDLLGPKIRSCHLKDVKLLDDFTFQLRECACGEGSFPLKEYISLAIAADPEMPMIIEHLVNDDAYRESVAYVTGLLTK